MASRKKKATPTEPPEMGERRVVMFRDVDRCFHCLLWFEMLMGHKHAIHYVYTEANGQVRHNIATIQDEKHIRDSIDVVGQTSPKHFEEYLRERLQKYGGNASAYDALNVPKPEQPTEAAPERVEAHDDMYNRAAKALGVPVAELRKKYGHLNPGLQMMNLRNRMRAKGLTL